VPENDLIIFGSDLNSTTGVAPKRHTHTTTTPRTWRALGPHGNARVNERGRNVVNLLKDNRMKAMNTCYQHKLRDTWHNTFNNSNYAHNHFLVCPPGKKISITDERVCRDGCQNDHLHIEIEVKIKSRRVEANSVGPNAKKKMSPYSRSTLTYSKSPRNALPSNPSSLNRRQRHYTSPRNLMRLQHQPENK
jgi:hypothetical protein